jgi:hypothetical protein
MYPDGVPSTSLYEGYTFGFKWIDLANPPQNSNLARILQSGSEEETILKQQGLYKWSNMVYSYMKRCLTFEQDKLIAISGVARRLQPSIQSDYLAGLWKTDLPLQLLWRGYSLRGVTKVPTRTDAYCAPSWSWASVTGHILVHNLALYILPQGKVYMIQILESNIFLKTGDTMGQVSGGSLKLRGWLRSFELITNSDHLHFVYRGKSVAKAMVDDMHSQKNSKWYCLPIIAQRFYSASSTAIWGLVLDRSGPLSQYRRVGLFHTHTAFDEFELFERPSYPWEPSSMKVKFTRNVSWEDSFQNQTAVPELHDSREEENDWVESVITIV